MSKVTLNIAIMSTGTIDPAVSDPASEDRKAPEAGSYVSVSGMDEDPETEEKADRRNPSGAQEQEIPDWDFCVEDTARAVIEKVLANEHCPYDAEVSLTLVDDAEIHRLNREFRGIDRETDVLSFPNVEFAAPADFSVVEEDKADCLDPETGNLVLGDIVINTNRVRSQAREYGHSRKREFAFLTAHSVLHLCGYDHMTPDEAAVMEAKQEAALQELGITRDAR